MQAKPWYKSKTILASIVAFVATLFRLIGIEIGDLTATTVDDILSLVTLVGTVVAIFSRVYAWGKITFGKPNIETIANVLLVAFVLLFLTGCVRDYSASVTDKHGNTYSGSYRPSPFAK